MIRNFFSTPNIMGRLVIIMLFVGGAVFAGAFDGFVVETQASSCCGGGMDDAIFSSSGNNGGGGGGGGNKCSCLGETKDCSCGNNPTCAGSTNDVCKGSCSPSDDGCGCDGTRCKNDSKCDGNCSN